MHILTNYLVKPLACNLIKRYYIIKPWLPEDYDNKVHFIIENDIESIKTLLKKNENCAFRIQLLEEVWKGARKACI